MRRAWLAAIVLAALCGSGRAQDEDMADSFARLQKRAAEEQAGLAARRAEVDRRRSKLSPAPGVFSKDPRCKLIRYRPGGAAERARLLADEMAAHIMRVNGLSIPGFCGVVFWPGHDLDSRAFLLIRDKLAVSDDDAKEARIEAAAPKAIKLYAGVIEKAPEDSVLAAFLGHELAHLVNMHGVAQQMHDDALTGVAVEWNSSDFDNPSFRALDRWKLGYDQAQEFEADRLGALYIRRAGYAADGMERMVSLLDDPDAKAKLTDHPSTDDRLRRLRSEPVKEEPAAAPVLRLQELRRLLGQ